MSSIVNITLYFYTDNTTNFHFKDSLMVPHVLLLSYLVLIRSVVKNSVTTEGSVQAKELTFVASSTLNIKISISFYHNSLKSPIFYGRETITISTQSKLSYHNFYC